MDIQFARTTRKIINALPYWFAIRKDPQNSIGAAFLNVAGLELDELVYILDYAYKQTKLDGMDDQYLNAVWKGILPIYATENSKIEAKTKTGIELKQKLTVEDFHLSINESTLINPELYWDDPFYIDFERQILYVRKNYDDIIEVSTDSGPYIEIKIEYSPVWNFFDEFGLLFNCSRIFGESNYQYRERLLDVFRNQANSSMEGFLNGMARELGLRKNRIVRDGGSSILLDGSMIVLNEIRLNGIFVDLERVWLTEDNQVWLSGDIEKSGEEATISYVVGIEMHTLHNKADYPLQQRLFNIDSSATNLLKYYSESIKAEVPILWGQWRWNEGYWDVSDEKVGGRGFIPNLTDAKIAGFQAY